MPPEVPSRPLNATTTDQGTPAAQRPPVKIDDSNIQSHYVNFCRVTGTPEELIIDCGLNTQPYGQADTPVVFDQRLVMNYYTAKRLLGALQMTLQRHEQMFGILELDPQKRLANANRKPASPEA